MSSSAHSNNHLDSFRKFLQNKGLQSITIKNYLSDLRRYLVWASTNFSRQSPEDPITLKSYIDFLETKNTPTQTISRYQASLKSFSQSLGQALVTNTISSLNHHQLLEKFKKQLIRDKKSPSTIKNYLSDLNHFLTWIANSPIILVDDYRQVFDANTLSVYDNYLKNIHTTSSVVSRRKSSIHQLANFAFEQGIIDKNVFAHQVKTPSPQPLYWLKRKVTPVKKAQTSTGVWRLYSRYNALPFTPYLHLAILTLFTAALTVFGYNQIFRDTKITSAYPANPTRPTRQLSFQGRLTDSAGTPISTAVNVLFKLYTAVSGGTQLYTSGTCSVTPDSNGIFNTLIGDTVCGAEIASSVFTENSAVWLEVTVASETLSPRQQIATVAYALNTETVQGFPISSTTSAIRSSLVVMNASGDIVLGEQSQAIKTTSGTFGISGNTLTLSTNATTNGNISLAPDGAGQLLAIGGTTTQDYLRVTNASLTSGSLISGYVGNNTATGDLLTLSAGSVETDRLNVAATGKTTITAVSKGDAALIVDQKDSAPLFTASASGTPKFTLLNTGSGQFHQASSITTTVGALTFQPASGSNVNLILATTGDFVVNTDQLYVDTSAGNVGIGTTAPATQLDVYGGGIRLGANNNAADILNTSAGGVANGNLYWGSQLLCTAASSNCGWATAASVVNHWNLTGGTIFPYNNTVDLLVGGDSTASAKFAFINVYAGTPTASISAGTSGSTTLTATGTLSTTKMLPLTLGGATTGPIQLSPKGTTGLNVDGTGNVGIGTTGPSQKLEVVGNSFLNGFVGVGQAPHASWSNSYGVVQVKNAALWSQDGAIDTLLTTNSYFSGSNYVAQLTGAATRLRLSSSGGLNIGTAPSVTAGSNQTFTDYFVLTNTGNVGIGTTAPSTKLNIVSTSTSGADFLLTNTGISTSGTIAGITADATTTGDILTISSTGLTSGSALVMTGPSSTGVTDHFLKITSDVGSASSLIYGAPDFSGSAVTGYGLNITATDATANANTDYAGYYSLALTGNAAKTGVGLYSTLSTSSTTADTLVAADLVTSTSGIITTGTRSVYGLRSQPASTGASSGGTTNVYGAYLKSGGTVAAGGTINSYGAYIANGTMNTTGTSTNIGLYVETPSGADTNYAAIFAGGNVGIGTTSPYSQFDVFGAPAANIHGQIRIFDTTTAAAGTGGGITLAGKYSAAGLVVDEAAAIKALKSNGTDENYSFDMGFYTRSNGSSPAEAMRILNDGNVGIGTSAPQTQLHLSKSVAGTSELRIEGPSGHVARVGLWETTVANPTDGGYLEYDGTNNYIEMGVRDGGTTDTPLVKLSKAARWINIGAGSSASGTNGVAIGKDAASTHTGAVAIGEGVTSFGNNTLSIGANNIRALIADSAGNIGIGTTTANTKLELDSGTADISGLRFTKLTSASTPGAAGAAVLSVDGSGNVVLVTDSTGSGSMPTGTVDGQTIRYNGSSWIATTTIFNDGTNVGIGTTVPLAKLDIAGSASSSGTLVFRGTTDPKIDILNGEAFGIRTSPGGDAGLAEKLTILGNGNVGIGSTSPQALLDINGLFYTVAGSGGGWRVAGDTHTGFYSPSNDKIIFMGNGQAALYADGTSGEGEFGVAIDPNAKLDVYATNGYAINLFELERGSGGVAGGQQYLTVSQNGLWKLTPYNTDSTTPFEIEVASTGDSSIQFDSDGNEFTIGVDSSDADKFKISDNTALGTNDRLIIDSNGNVGIGSASPSMLLDVAGSATISGTLSLAPNLPGFAGTCTAGIKGKQYFDGTDNKMYYCNGTTWTDMSGGAAGTPGGSDTQVQFNDGGSTFGGDAGMTYNKTTDVLTLAGQVISPYVIGGTATTSDLYLQTTTGTGTAGADMHFLVGTNGGTEAMTILNNGNVGIGSTAPSQPLEVTGNARFNAISYFANGTTYYVDASGNAKFLDIVAADTANPGLTVGDGSSGYFKVGGSIISDASGNLTLSSDTTTTDIADTIFNFTGGSGSITSTTGALTLQPASGSNLNVTLATTGDFAVNTNQLYVDTSAGNVGIGTTAPSTKLNIVSTSTSGADFLLTNTGISTSGTIAGITADATTTGDILTISSTGLTSGSALVMTGPSSTGVTDHFLKLTSDVGSASSLIYGAPDFSGSAVTGYGLNITATDATANANTDYAGYYSLTLTGNAAKTGYGLYSKTSTSSTTADTTYAGYFTADTKGAMTTGTSNVYGLYSTSLSEGANGATVNSYAGYFKSSGTLTSGTINSYGVYIANGTMNTTGTSTNIGLYVETPSGADTNYAAIFAGGNVGIGTTAPSRTLDVTGTWGGNVVTTSTTDSGVTSTITTPALAYYVQSSDSTGACSTGSKTFDITGLSSTEGSYAYIVSKATDSGCTSGTLTVTVQINASTIGTVANAASNNTITENYVVAYINGAWRIVGLNSATAGGSDTADLAEWTKFIGAQPQPGELVSPSDYVKITRTQSAHDPTVLGIVSTNPHTIYGQQTEDSIPLVLTGRIPTIVTSVGGDIIAGDSIVSSPIPGAGMSAKEAGQSVGKALESFNPSSESCQSVSSYEEIVWPQDNGSNNNHPCFSVPASSFDQTVQQTLRISFGTQSNDKIFVGKIMALANLSHTEGKAPTDIKLNGTSIFDQIVERFSYNGLSFVDTVKEIVRAELATISTSLSDTVYELKITDKLISPLANIDTLVTHNFRSDTATISGTLYAENISNPDLTNLKSTLSGLQSDYSTASAILASIQAKYDSFSSLNSPQTSDPLATADLSQTDATFSGSTNLSLENLSVENSLLVNTLNSDADKTLFIEPLANAPINLLAGLMTLYPDGHIAINGNLVITGTLYTDFLQAQSATVSGQLALRATNQFTKLLSIFNESGQEVGSVDASGSARFNSLASSQIITQGLTIASPATSSADPQNPQSSTNTNTSIGTASILALQTEITIYSTSIDANTLIYLTPISPTDNQVLFVKNKTVGVSFTVAIANPVSTDIQFNYWLIKTIPALSSVDAQTGSQSSQI